MTSFISDFFLHLLLFYLSLKLEYFYVQKKENSNISLIYQTEQYNQTRGAFTSLHYSSRFLENTVAKSAFYRAKTLFCKDQIRHLAKSLHSGAVYPKRIKSQCPLDGKNAGDYLGCFFDSKNDRALEHKFVFDKTNSPSVCIDSCYTVGCKYAALQYGSECWCGTDGFGKHGRAAENACNMTCPGNHSLNCGGTYVQNVFLTGIGDKVNNKVNYITWNDLTEAERYKPARIAFLLMLNGRSFRQVKRLLNRIYHKWNIYYIHIDSRQGFMRRKIKELISNFPNIQLTPWSLPTIWGGASHVRMMLHVMADLLNADVPHWDYLINLSESDFPVRPLSDLTAFLTRYPDKVFLWQNDKSIFKLMDTKMFHNTFLECEGRMWRIGERPLPIGLRLANGLDWFAFSRSFATYVTDTNNMLVQEMLRYWQLSLIALESFFHTVVFNSPFCTKWVNDGLHFSSFKGERGCQCQQRHIIDWCGCSPIVLRPFDFPHIQNFTTFFARKFDPTLSQNVINMVDGMLLRTRPPRNAALSYWESIYDQLDVSADDTLFSTLNSLAMLAIDRLYRGAMPIYDPASIKIIEASSFFYNDFYRGTVISFQFKSRFRPYAKLFTVQALLENKIKETITCHKTLPLFRRIDALYVSDRYDVKEYLSRNFLRAIGPTSEFGAVIYLNGGQPVNVSVDWDITDIETNNVLFPPFRMGVFARASSEGLVMPGLYTVFVSTDDGSTTLASTDFVVMPITHHDRHLIGSIHRAISFNGFVPHKSGYIEKDLASWAFNLAEEAWIVSDLCSVSSAQNYASFYEFGFIFPPCRNVAWSTLSIDQKSEFLSDSHDR